MTDIAKYACDPRWQVPLAEDALAKQYFEQKSLVTWQQQIRKSSNVEGESRNNHRYAVLVPDLATQRIQSYPKHKKLLGRRKRVDESFSSRQKSRKSFTLTNVANPGEDLSWNHRTSTLRRSETKGMAERAERRIKEGTSAVLLQSGLDEKWWADSMECDCFLRNVQDLLADWKTPYESRFGGPCKGPVSLFGVMVEHYPISARGPVLASSVCPDSVAKKHSSDMH